MKIFTCLLELFQYYKIYMKSPLLLTNCKTASRLQEDKLINVYRLADRQNRSFDNKRLMRHEIKANRMNEVSS